MYGFWQSLNYGSDEQVSRESLDSTILGQFIVVAVVSVDVCSTNAKCFELNDIDVHMTIYAILSAFLWWKMFGWERRWMPLLIFGFKIKFLHIEQVFTPAIEVL